MKLFKKYLAVTMAIMLVISAFPTFTYASSVPALFTNATYTLDADVFTIQGGSDLIVEGETTVASFIANLTFADGALYKVVTDATYTTWQQAVTDLSSTLQALWNDPSATAKLDSDTISSTDKLVVKSGDDLTLEVYTITATLPAPPPAPER